MSSSIALARTHASSIARRTLIEASNRLPRDGSVNLDGNIIGTLRR